MNTKKFVGRELFDGLIVRGIERGVVILGTPALREKFVKNLKTMDWQSELRPLFIKKQMGILYENQGQIMDSKVEFLRGDPESPVVMVRIIGKDYFERIDIVDFEDHSRESLKYLVGRDIRHRSISGSSYRVTEVSDDCIEAGGTISFGNFLENYEVAPMTLNDKIDRARSFLGKEVGHVSKEGVKTYGVVRSFNTSINNDVCVFLKGSDHNALRVEDVFQK